VYCYTEYKIKFPLNSFVTNLRVLQINYYQLQRSQLPSVFEFTSLGANTYCKVSFHWTSNVLIYSSLVWCSSSNVCVVKSCRPISFLSMPHTRSHNKGVALSLRCYTAFAFFKWPVPLAIKPWDSHTQQCKGLGFLCGSPSYWSLNISPIFETFVKYLDVFSSPPLRKWPWESSSLRLNA
jgi:hypothetical protein